MSYIVPTGFVLMGTCGACGGPLLTPQIVQSYGTAPDAPHVQCASCQRVAKPLVHPSYGPIQEMLP